MNEREISSVRDSPEHVKVVSKTTELAVVTDVIQGPFK